MLDFILSNIYVVAIIGFALISFLGKGKSGAGKQPKGGMPTFGGGAEASDRRSIDDRGSSRDEEEYNPSPVYQSTSYNDNDRDRERREAFREREKDMDLIRRSEGPERTSLVSDEERADYKVATVTSSPKPISPLAEEAAKGIIWSEILGPPRAKRGFHKRNS